MIEKAIYICRRKDLKFCTDDFERLYFGVEFCPNLIPSLDDIQRVLDFCKEKKIKFTFVTPWCTDSAIRKIEKILRLSPPYTEIVFNDWGLWQLVSQKFKKKNFIFCLGRLLIRHKNDPRAIIIKDKKKLNFIKGCVLSNKTFQSFLITRGIKRVELNNSFQGYNFSLEPNISTSIYYPYVFLSVTTKCIFKKRINIERCDYNCKDRYLICNIKKFNVPIITRGNTEFYRNTDKPSEKDFLGWRINRTVYMPFLTM